jgi:3-deoxy-D-manno-octulosonate 8-phosphate phosphatase (KDO 8-P phosphatase)
MPIRPKSAALARRLQAVRLLLCDVDGVLTDGSVWIGADAEFKRFNIVDGMGLGLLRRAGIKTGWVSSRPSAATTRRAEELKVDFLHQAKSSKVEAVTAILARAKLDWAAVCFVGDDLVDLGPMRRAGLAIAVADARPEVKGVAHFVTKASGGRGAVREVAELILNARGAWSGLVAEFSE